MSNKYFEDNRQRSLIKLSEVAASILVCLLSLQLLHPPEDSKQQMFCHVLQHP